MFYFIIFFLLLFSGLYIYCINRKLDGLFFNVWLFILFFISAFRYETGNDWYTYERIFDLSLDIKTLFNNPTYYLFFLRDIEIGYRIFNSLVKNFGGSLQTVFFITGFFSFISLKKFIERNSNHKTLSLLIYYSLFFFNFNMSIIRQGIALSIFLLSFNLIQDRKFFKYVLMIGLASLFHVSSLILFPIYFIGKLKFSKNTYILVFIIGLLIRIVGFDLLGIVIKILPHFILGDLLVYMTPNNYMNLISFGNIERLIMIFLIFRFGNYIINVKGNSNIFLNLYLIYVMINLVFFKNEVLVSRIRFYFEISYIIILPIYIDVFKKNIDKAIILSCIFIFSIIPIITFLSGDINNKLYNPYQNLIIHKYILQSESDGYERFQDVIRLYK